MYRTYRMVPTDVSHGEAIEWLSDKEIPIGGLAEINGVTYQRVWGRKSATVNVREAMAGITPQRR